MLRLSARRCRTLGAEEAVILTDDGYVVEGAYSALLWWRGDILCGPPASISSGSTASPRERAHARGGARGRDVRGGRDPAELDGTEVWALSALHGTRIVTSWVDGPCDSAELPGRLRDAGARGWIELRRPIHDALDVGLTRS